MNWEEANSPASPAEAAFLNYLGFASENFNGGLYYYVQLAFQGDQTCDSLRRDVPIEAPAAALTSNYGAEDGALILYASYTYLCPEEAPQG